MSKNLTRKGLALGAAFALVSTAVVSSPALAADGVVLKANTGTTLAAPVTETLTLNASLVPTLPAANIQQLKYKVVTDGSYVLKAVATSAGASTTVYTNDDNRTYAGVLDAGVDTVAGTADDVAGYAAARVNTSAVITPGTTPTTTAANTLVLSVDSTQNATTATTGDAPSATSATETVTVTAWIDSNNDSVVDAGEAQQSVTVSFIKYSEITATTTITAPLEGDTTASATVVFNNVNNEQLTAAEVGASFTKGDDTALDGTASKVVKAGVAWDATNGYFKYTTDTITALVKNQAVKVQPLMKNGGVGTDATAKVATAATATISARATGSVEADTVDSATTAQVAAGATPTADVLLNSSFGVKAIVKDTATPAAALAGAAVAAKVTVVGATLSSTVTVTVNGTTYTSAAALPGATGVDKLALVTDANGEAVVNITTAGFAAGNDVVVEFTAENRTATITANAAAASYVAYVTNWNGVATAVDGSAANVDVLVVDQFGGVPANGKYDVNAVFVSSGQATTAATNATNAAAAVVNGRATLSITDNGVGAGNNVYDLKLSTIDVASGYSAQAVFADNFTIQITSAAQAPGVILEADATLNTDTGVYTEAPAGAAADLALADLFAHDGRIATTAAPTFASATGAEIAGTVTTTATATAAAALVDGVAVTISGEGLLFSTSVTGGIDGNADGDLGDAGEALTKTVFGLGSLTAYTNGSGAYAFKVFSNKAGKQTVTITAGGASRTVVIDSYDAAAAGTGTSLVITAPDAVAPGSTLSVSATLTDKYGNPVATSGTNTAGDPGADFAYSYTGPGLMVGSAPTKFGTDGTAKLGYFLGSNDSGTITVVFQYDANGDNDFADTGDISVTKTIVIGTVGNTGALASWTKNLNDGTVKMYAKNIVGAGKVQFMLNGKEIAWVRAADATDPKLREANGSYYLVRTVELVEGQKNVLEIYVDGVRTTRTAYTY